MGKRLINVDEVEEIVPVLVDKLLENNLITEVNMENKLNVQKLGYEVGEPMWVHWDNRYVLRGGHILGKCPDENLITTVGYLAYMDDKSIILGRGIENHCDEDGTRRVKDTIQIPMSLVASYGSFNQ